MSIPAPQADPKVISMDRPAKAAAEIVIRADHLDLTFETNDGPVHALRDITLGDFSPGQMFDYTTTAHEGRFTEYLSALDYRDPYPIVAETPEGQEALRAFERRQRVRDEGQRRRVDL